MIICVPTGQLRVSAPAKKREPVRVWTSTVTPVFITMQSAVVELLTTGFIPESVKKLSAVRNYLTTMTDALRPFSFGA